MMLTLGQAAKETGVSKTAISRAVKSGRLSATRNELGEYQIDPAELFRVYPATGSVDSNLERDATPKDSSGLQGQVEVLRELVRQIEGERDDLRRRLDRAEEARKREAEEREKASAEIRRLTLMITDRREPTAPPQPEAAPIFLEPERPPRRAVHPALWAILAAALGAFAASWWYWWPWWN
jgi:DNA-binding transcriptional regulator GbsR (MarR family)